MTPAPDPPVHLGMQRPPLHEDGRLRVGNASRGGLLAREVIVLRSRWQRARQAAWRRLHRDQALFLAPAPAVHTLAARHSIRLIFLDAHDRVIGQILLPPWRNARAPSGSAAALFLHSANDALVEDGDKLEWLVSQPRLEERADWLVEGQPPEAAGE